MPLKKYRAESSGQEVILHLISFQVRSFKHASCCASKHVSYPYCNGCLLHILCTLETLKHCTSDYLVTLPYKTRPKLPCFTYTIGRTEPLLT